MNPKTTPFLPTEIDYPTNPSDPEAVKNFLIDNLKSIIDSLNQKDVAIYFPLEAFNGQSWFQPGSTREQRNGFRKVVDFGALPNNTFKDVAHGITIDEGFTLTHLWASATDRVNNEYLPIPYASTTGDNIELQMLNNGSKDVVRITTQSDRSAFKTCYVVIEYVKSE